MIRSKKLIILLLFFILFSTYSPNYKSNNKSIIFGLETIKLEGLRILNKKEDRIRFKEKLCFISKKRPKGKLL